jgi:hypothetical protein
MLFALLPVFLYKKCDSLRLLQRVDSAFLECNLLQGLKKP